MERVTTTRSGPDEYVLPTPAEASADLKRYLEIRGQSAYALEISLLRHKAHAHLEGMLNTQAGRMSAADQAALFEPYNTICADGQL